MGVECGAASPDGPYSFCTDAAIDCDEGDEASQAYTKLHNLGFDELLLEERVRAFQHDYGIGESGLDAGTLPPETGRKLWSLFERETCDAAMPAPATAG